jgi:hypothetical protein
MEIAVPDEHSSRLPSFDREPTKIDHLAATRRLEALFKAMAADFLLREQFVTDPAQIMAEYILCDSLPRATADLANRFLYSVLANHKLRHWFGTFAADHAGSAVTRKAFLLEFGHAVARHGDEPIIFALMQSSMERDRPTGFRAFEWLIVSLASVVGIAERARGSVVASSPTGGSPTGGSPTGGSPTGGSPTGGSPTGGSPTGGSPTGGSPTGGSPTGGSPTGGSPTGGSPTGGSPTGGSVIFSHLPDYVLVALNELVGYAEELREAGALGLQFSAFQRMLDEG